MDGLEQMPTIDRWARTGSAVEQLASATVYDLGMDIRIKGGRLFLFRDDAEIARAGVHMVEPSADDWESLLAYGLQVAR